MAITHVESSNHKLLDEIEQTLNKAKRIVVITGAGISTNCGIPDFRSKEGLYSLINAEYDSQTGSKPTAPGQVKGKDLFSSTVWQNEDSTTVFYKFIASLRRKIKDDVKQTTQTHKFIRRIRDQKRLLRCYTQNIDGLETRDGLSTDISRGKGSRSRFTKKMIDLPNYPRHNVTSGKLDGGCEVVQLHGDLETVRCTICSRGKTWSLAEDSSFLNGTAPVCRECEEENIVRQVAGKRGSAVGSLRPNIVLYGENNPMETEIGSLLAHDLTFGPDLLIIMGTSLKVHGLKTVVKEFAKAVHSKKNGKVMFVNLSGPAESTWKSVIDYWVDMDCDEWCKDKMRIKQTELTFETKEPASKKVAQGKENIPQTPAAKRTGKKISGLPTPPTTVKKRVFEELEPISATHKSPRKRICLTDSIENVQSQTPTSLKIRKNADFKVWDEEEEEEESINLQQASQAAIEDSPSKSKKRRLV